MHSVGLAYLLWLLSGCGVLGFHRFYLGKPRTGILWFFSFGLFGFGALYDFFTLGSQVREANYHAAINGTVHVHHDHVWRNVYDGEARIVAEKKENPERILLRAAKKSGGIISPADLALEADIPLEEAKKQLDALVGKGFAELRVRKTGTLVYTIPEFMDKETPLEDM
jgi:TM2 domain-containing membrane protein YozV